MSIYLSGIHLQRQSYDLDYESGKKRINFYDRLRAWFRLYMQNCIKILNAFNNIVYLEQTRSRTRAILSNLHSFHRSSFVIKADTILFWNRLKWGIRFLINTIDLKTTFFSSKYEEFCFRIDYQVSFADESIDDIHFLHRTSDHESRNILIENSLTDRNMEY